MRLPLFLAATLTATAVSVAAIDVNGWYPCGPTTKPRKDLGYEEVVEVMIPVNEKVAFECAQVPMPLCHEGVCKSEAGERIQVFVKRIVAKPTAAQSAKSVWFIAGGPGGTSSGLEGEMNTVYKKLNGTVSVYSLDHRGTGRSHYLNCEAAQVDVDGSESGKYLTLDEINACHKDLHFRYKNKGAAFSITSAATDLKKLIDGLNSNEDVYLLGLSYGTSVLQRLIQLQPSSRIKGFIFDGVSLNPSKASTIPSAWGVNNGYTLPAMRRLFEACYDDASCPLKLKSRETVVEETLAILESLDGTVDTNLCAKYLATWGLYVKPSDSLRDLLTGFPPMMAYRKYLPLIYAKLTTCTQEELDLIGPLMDPAYPYNVEAPMQEAVNGTLARHRRLQAARAVQQPAFVDPLRSPNTNVYKTIVASELYGPLPSLDQLTALYRANPFARVNCVVAELAPAYQDPSRSYLFFDNLNTYCAVSGHDEDVCQRVRTMIQEEPPLTYKDDQFAGVPLELGSEASALILNGGLDFQTPIEFGQQLLSLLQGGRGKLSVTFDYGGHCRGEAVESFMSMPCRVSIIAQFVLFNGDVANIDQSCLKQQRKPSFPATYP